MSEWLDLMLEELERKKQEQREADAEAERRVRERKNQPPAADQSVDDDPAT